MNPMLTKPVQDAINAQIQFELNSAYTYLALSSQCESENLSGCAKWLRVQWEEEVGHAMKFMDYVNERGGVVTLGAIDKPAVNTKMPKEIFEYVLAHEQKVTASINKLYELALAEKDYPTQGLLQWFIKEQVEEEKTATEIVALMNLAGSNGPSLLMLDRQLGMRAKS
jgi:ferritin